MKYLRLAAAFMLLYLILISPILSNFVTAQETVQNRTLPHWSPDGGYLLFASWIDPLETEIWLSDSDGSNQNIVFQSRKDEDTDIWRINLDSRNSKNLTTDFTSSAIDPDVNHLTNQIAFTAVDADEGGVDIWIMDADGSNLHRFPDNNGDN